MIFLLRLFSRLLLRSLGGWLNHNKEPFNWQFHVRHLLSVVHAGKHDADGEPVGGAWAEYAVVPAKKLTLVPDGLSMSMRSLLLQV